MSRRLVKTAIANRKKNVRFEDIPPNRDITVPAGPQAAVRRVFEEFDLDILLDSFKRKQGLK